MEDRQTEFHNFLLLHMHILIPKISFSVTVHKTFSYITLSISWEIKIHIIIGRKYPDGGCRYHIKSHLVEILGQKA